MTARGPPHHRVARGDGVAAMQQPRHAHCERRAIAELRFHRHLTPEARHQPAHDEQTEADATPRRRTLIGTLAKRLEHDRQIAGSDADASVDHGYGHLVALAI